MKIREEKIQRNLEERKKQHKKIENERDRKILNYPGKYTKIVRFKTRRAIVREENTKNSLQQKHLIF